MPMIAINSKEDFDNKVRASKELIIAGFTADWCPHCKNVGPHVQQFLQEHPEVNFARVDVDKAQGVDDEFNIMTIPTLACFKDGKMLSSKMIAYLQPHEIFAFIQENLDQYK